MKKYTVQAGDTLGAIAVAFYGQSAKAQDIAEANVPHQIRQSWNFIGA